MAKVEKKNGGKSKGEEPSLDKSRAKIKSAIKGAADLLKDF